MAPAVLSTGALLSKVPSHRKFRRVPPEISIKRVPSQPGNGNSRAAVTETIDLPQKILRNGRKRTPLSANGNLLKKRKLEFGPNWTTCDRSVQTLEDGSKILQNQFSGKTGVSPSGTPSATNGVLTQSLVTNESDNGLDHHQHPATSGSSDRDEGEAKVLSVPERRNIAEQVGTNCCANEPGEVSSGILIGPGRPPPVIDTQGTDPAKGSVADPQSLPVTSDDAQCLASHTHHTDQPKRFRTNQQSSKSPMGIAKIPNECVSKETISECSRHEAVPSPENRARSEGEIPTVVQEFSGRMESKRRATKRKNKKTTPNIAEKQANVGATDPVETHRYSSLTQFAGGEITVVSPQSCQDTRSCPGIPLNGLESICSSPKSPFDKSDCCEPCAEVQRYSQSANESNGFAHRSRCLNPAGEWKFGHRSQLDPIWYSSSALRSLVPYRPEGFNNHPQMKFKCVFCSRLFLCHDDLQGHVDQRHYGDDPYECPFCLERFNHNYKYSDHLNEHVRRKDYPSFQCRTCSACFSSEWEHDLHATTHDDALSCCDEIIVD